MEAADVAMVYYNPHTIAHKKLKAITKEQVRSAFGSNDLLVYTESDVVIEAVINIPKQKNIILMMTSGNFDGIDFTQLADDYARQ
jgi:UDP-N-acetylmuramate: L-alanyl-gamma-D-glutamyl-meso-diaminopimelate ligase